MTERNKWRLKRLMLYAFLVFSLLVAGIVTQNQMPGITKDASSIKTVPRAPESFGLNPGRLRFIDSAVEASIKEDEIPGAVVLIGRKDGIEYFKAYGNRSVQPVRESMTQDTIFDISSLTKVVATTPSILLLAENGLVRLGDRVNRYLPRFKGGGKSEITIRQLLTHYSGLKADFDLSKRWFGYDAALEELWNIGTDFKPDTEFVYSDLNFIALGEIIRTVSGKTLDIFARENIFIPLGMTDTCFLPPPDLAGRIAPTEPRRSTLRYLHGQESEAPKDTMLRGEVHDPTAYRMNGVAGHAGLFSSAKDIALYAQMLLNLGQYQGGYLLSPLTVKAMSSPQSPPGSSQIRGYGWDIQSDYSSPRGDIFMEGYGHTGFTGTSLWIHPPTETFIIILTNRVHPDGGKNVNHLRGVIANIVAAAISEP